MGNILDLMASISLESLQKITQISFYIVAGSIAVFTFVKAKNGLLNSVNTEYQKRVIERLVEVSHEFQEHFDEKSLHYWTNDKSIKLLVDDVNSAFLDGPYLEYEDEYPYGYSRTAMSERIQYLLGKVKADPLIPSQIREAIFQTLDQAACIRDAIHHAALDEYYERIKQGFELYTTDGTDSEYDNFHNRVIHRLVENDCGIAEMNHRMDYITEIIQEYLESFNPVKRTLRVKPYTILEAQPIRVVDFK